jgi:hypothetical protein
MPFIYSTNLYSKLSNSWVQKVGMKKEYKSQSWRNKSKYLPYLLCHSEFNHEGIYHTERCKRAPRRAQG